MLIKNVNLFLNIFNFHVTYFCHYHMPTAVWSANAPPAFIVKSPMQTDMLGDPL